MKIKGYASLKRWTPKAAARAAEKRLAAIELLLQEIGGLYADQDQYVVDLVDTLARTGFTDIREAIQTAG